MIIKNNIIRLPRGESAQFSYIGIQKTGEPYILPVMYDKSLLISERKDYAVLAFTVTTGTNSELVIAKYCDLENLPMYDGETDYTPGGYHKFTQTEIVEYPEKSSALAIVNDASRGNFYVYRDPDTGKYWHIIKNANGGYQPARYYFEVGLNFLHDDTVELAPKEYLYEVALYFGQLTDAEIEALESNEILLDFPLKLVSAKQVLIKTKEFILEDSNNV